MRKIKHFFAEVNWLWHFVVICRIGVEDWHGWRAAINQALYECFYCGKEKLMINTIKGQPFGNLREPLPLFQTLRRFIKK